MASRKAKPASYSISVVTQSTCGSSAEAKPETLERNLINPPGNGHKITDWEKFRFFAQAHGDKTQAEMAQLWEEDISARTISRALKKIGFTRKKKTYGVSVNAIRSNGKHS